MKRRTLLRALLEVISVALVLAAGVAGTTTAAPSAAVAAVHAPGHVRHREPAAAEAVRPAVATGWQDAAPAVTLDPAAAIAALGCLGVLAFWGTWQSRHRCAGCGYCPVWCRCDELARRNGR